MTTVARRQTARKNEEVVAAGLGQEKVDKGQETAAEYIPMNRYMRCLPYKVLACARTFLPQRLIGCVMSQTSDAIFGDESHFPIRHYLSGTRINRLEPPTMFPPPVGRCGLLFFKSFRLFRFPSSRSLRLRYMSCLVFLSCFSLIFLVRPRSCRTLHIG